MDMFKRTVSILLATAVLAGAVSSTVGTVAAAQTKEVIPLKTWYTSPATDWESQATPIGNGFIGAMVFGGVDNERIQINEKTLWSGGPGAVANYEGGMSGNSDTIKKTIRQPARSCKRK